MSKDYRKKCSNCQAEIIMSKSDATGKWQPMNPDNSIHRCIMSTATATATANVDNKTPEKTPQNDNIVAATLARRDYTNEAEIIALKARLEKIESWTREVSINTRDFPSLFSDAEMKILKELIHTFTDQEIGAIKLITELFLEFKRKPL